MRRLWSVIAAVVVCITSASAQVQSVSRTASGAPDTDIRVGVYVNVRPDCTSGPLPSIQLTSPPENGKVTVKKATVTATNHKQCLALQVPAFVALYRSRADFVGVDALTLEVKFPGGERCSASVLRSEVDRPGEAPERVDDGSIGSRTNAGDIRSATSPVMVYILAAGSPRRHDSSSIQPLCAC
jgi:hypothetical protein